MEFMNFKCSSSGCSKASISTNYSVLKNISQVKKVMTELNTNRDGEYCHMYLILS